ncbi:MOSC domain-containing protein [Vibrio sp. 10N.261.55.A7]|uniref:MOSC domain-containing protein n=1 Tax=Vibrio sp. 10N.261.55.A7 TaxID=1880851 RepID=UPI000C858559|nr:MOSC domain-containing protein [Vibrio sp. 10N.261.55.A7]PMJ95700.1 sulfurase [Vibrio sp. 10N.261.55.A7]
MTNTVHLNGIYRGEVQSCYGFETAINKRLVEGAVYLSNEGLEGDQCADQRHHGGTERALHQYPIEHYQYWKEKHGADIDWQAPGMGENISSEGMTEESVCIGDQYRWGEAIIEVSQPRSPCFKLNKRWGVDDLSVDMQTISRCGWLYRVIRPGMVSADSPLELVGQVDNPLSIKEVCDIFFGDPLNKEGLAMLKQQSKLSDSWMSKVMERIATEKVENWDFRLLGYSRQ